MQSFGFDQQHAAGPRRYDPSSQPISIDSPSAIGCSPIVIYRRTTPPRVIQPHVSPFPACSAPSRSPLSSPSCDVAVRSASSSEHASRRNSSMAHVTYRDSGTSMTLPSSLRWGPRRVDVGDGCASRESALTSCCSTRCCWMFCCSCTPVGLGRELYEAATDVLVASLGLVTAMAWRDAFQSWFDTFRDGQSAAAWLIYAVVMTTMAVVVTLVAKLCSIYAPRAADRAGVLAEGGAVRAQRQLAELPARRRAQQGGNETTGDRIVATPSSPTGDTSDVDGTPNVPPPINFRAGLRNVARGVDAVGSLMRIVFGVLAAYGWADVATQSVWACCDDAWWMLFIYAIVISAIVLVILCIFVYIDIRWRTWWSSALRELANIFALFLSGFVWTDAFVALFGFVFNGHAHWAVLFGVAVLLFVLAFPIFLLAHVLFTQEGCPGCREVTREPFCCCACLDCCRPTKPDLSAELGRGRPQSPFGDVAGAMGRMVGGAGHFAGRQARMVFADVDEDGQTIGCFCLPRWLARAIYGVTLGTLAIIVAEFFVEAWQCGFTNWFGGEVEIEAGLPSCQTKAWYMDLAVAVVVSPLAVVAVLYANRLYKESSSVQLSPHVPDVAPPGS
eukprot:TRINITY_DN38352_c0_g1_i1.p1 TRINITY_DN38352_c0_g1~~TRINITY_DN38352_c0_g1_i1.p1  ORF type:complete len:616 (-),score=43.77 TRINITY_DN38352_c0_g1_i1:448-2295(-)